MNTEFYKVVRRENNKFVSSIVNQFNVEYKVEEWTTPILKNSKLFVFNNIYSATSYLRRFVDDGIIYKCDVTNPKATLYCGCGMYSYTQYELFWEWYNLDIKDQYRIPNFVGTCFKNTFFCDSVKLIEPV